MTELQSGEQGLGPAPLRSPDPRSQLVLEEARRGLDQQKKDLEGLRNRAVAVVGIAGALVSLALQRSPSNVLGTCTQVGVELSILCAICGAAVLAPRTFAFSFDAKLMDDRIDSGSTFEEMARDTALGLDRDYDENQGSLEVMHEWFFTSLLLLGAETGLLLIGLR